MARNLCVNETALGCSENVMAKCVLTTCGFMLYGIINAVVITYIYVDKKHRQYT